jgi:TonB-linked SusC/RagA family outer membrane protein
MKKTTTKIVMALLCPYRSWIIHYKTKGFLLILFLLSLNSSVFAQSKIKIMLTGTVYSAEDNKPLPGATIHNRLSGVNIATDINGKFQFATTDTSGVLDISFIGYRTGQLFFNSKNQGPFKVLLNIDASILKEVIVSTGYQTLPKERATGSFVQLDSAIINRRVSSDIVSRLEGVVPGLLFNRNTSNSANGTTDINIRGHSTLFSNDQPLIVIDGFPYDGNLNNINPNDIESITVLKDAAAASIWGVRSGNGVIVLTTKKGKQNQKLVTELNANVTIGKKPDLFYNPNFLNANNYINIEQLLFKQGYYNSLINDPTQAISPVVQLLADQQSGKISADEANSQINALRNQDVRKDLSNNFYSTSVLQQYALNFRGGSDKSDYFFSVGDDHNLSALDGNSNNRLTINGNYNFYPVKNLQITAGINFIKFDGKNNSPVGNINSGGFFAGYIYPYAQLVDAQGNSLPIVKDYKSEFINSAPQKGFLNWQYRPLDELNNADNTSNSLDNRINLGINYKIIPGLTAAVKYQYEKASVLENNYYSTATYYARNLINEYSQQNANGSFLYPVPNDGILQQSNAFLNSHHFRGQLNYNTTIKQKHELNAILGGEISSTGNSGSSNTAYGYDKNTESNYTQINFADYYSLNPSGVGSSQIPNNQSFFKTTDHYISYFGNASYTYDRRYTFSLSGRIDKSNLFGVATNQKSVPLYSTGLSWDLGKEKFYHVDWLPYLKLRATYGYNANVNKSATAVTTLLQQSNSYYSGIPYDVVANPGNPELRWEKVRMTNLGIDYGFKNNIVTGSLEFYFKKATDLFGSSPLPPSTGNPLFFGNTASTSGKGFDIVINTHNLYRPDFKWTSNILISHVLDRVTGYNEQSNVITYLTAGSGNAGVITPLSGAPIFAIYSFRSGPLTHDKGDPQGYLNGQLSTDYSSIVANTKVQELYYNGPSRPTTFGSFRNTFTYKNWSLSANIIFKLNYYFRKSSTAISYSGIIYGGVNKDYTNRWQKPGDELLTTVPSIQLPPSDNNRDYFYQYSQALVDKGDHIRFQDLKVSYDLNKSQKPKLPFSHLQIYGYVNNIGILWRANHDHLDPDLYSGATPLPLTISLGINSTF